MARETCVLWGAAALVQGRRRSPAPQRTSRPQLTDVAVRRRAQVRVTLPGRPKPHTALRRGGVWLPWQPVLAALQAKSLAPRRQARLSTLHSREANPYVQAPADGKEGGDSGGSPKIGIPLPTLSGGQAPHSSLSGGPSPCFLHRETETQRQDLVSMAHSSAPPAAHDMGLGAQPRELCLSQTHI